MATGPNGTPPREGGIDEAGRGPVLGPLVVAGVSVAQEDIQILEEMGCKDSKRLRPGQRERIARLLHTDDRVHIEIRIITAAALDEEMAGSSLNDIEMVRFQEIAGALVAAGACRIVADAADVDAARFGRRLSSSLPASVEVVSVHRADASHLTVAAASIIAKVTRDAAIGELAKRLERKLGRQLGSGYPSDGKTTAFLRAWHDAYGDLPEGTRHSWKTAKAILAPRQSTLDNA